MCNSGIVSGSIIDHLKKKYKPIKITKANIMTYKDSLPCLDASNWPNLSSVLSINIWAELNSLSNLFKFFL